MASYEHAALAEFIELNAQFRQCGAVFEQQTRLNGSDFNGFRDQEFLRFDLPCCEATLHFLVKNPFMQRMLIDQEHSFVGFDDDVGVVKLKRA